MTIDYETLIDGFLNQGLPAAEFEKRFLKAFGSEPGGMNPQVFQVLDGLFADVDAYWPECKEGEESAFEISEAALRRQAAKALVALRKLREG